MKKEEQIEYAKFQIEKFKEYHLTSVQSLRMKKRFKDHIKFVLSCCPLLKIEDIKNYV